MPPMRAELLTIGSELLSGVTLNTNAPYLARRLAECGIVCQRQTAVSDERPLLLQALREAMGRADLLILTGGLGPTFDDITTAAIAEATGHPLRFVPSVAAAIRRFYTRRHRRLQQAALRQASLPEGSRALPNPIGTAPGIWLALPSHTIIALPGVPSEMRAITEAHVLPRLKRAGTGAAIASRTLRTIGLVELSIESVLRRLRIPATIQVGLYPHLRMVDVRLTATAASQRRARAALATIEQQLRQALGASVYGTDEETLEGAVGRLLTARRRTLGVAESCTGGLLSHQLTNIPGSSRYFRGGIIAYHNAIKQELLGVPPQLLARVGAVSAPTAKAMAVGVRQAGRTDFGMALTGIAGPDGGTPAKPVGLVYLALADARGARAKCCRFLGDRLSIKTQATQAALDWLRRSLLRK